MDQSVSTQWALDESQLGGRSGEVAEDGCDDARMIAGVVLTITAMALILVRGPQAGPDPFAERITQALRLQCGPGVQVLRTAGAGSAYAVPLRCQLYVDGRRAGQGSGKVDVAHGECSLCYEIADRGADTARRRRAGSMGGTPDRNLTATAMVE